ncbi:MAG: maltose alpha-D-glucosyltransferase / alpha-amylase, partial [Microbacteriaceae bacterium]|nr:maltose alpha-D-glucosyltransferase / alpha-amylase [Microbacteriaceae bacterium]
AGTTLTDLFGGGRFPAFDEHGRVTITLGTQSFFWLKVGRPEVPTTTSAIPVQSPATPST